MKIKRTVSPAKLAANQCNSHKSSGPKTERGKRMSRMNALVLGFYSDDVVIVHLDGVDSRQRYQELLNALMEEYNPCTPTQMWAVELLAQSMWRLRRIRRVERSAVELVPSLLYARKEGPVSELMATLEFLRCKRDEFDARIAELERSSAGKHVEHDAVANTIGSEFRAGGAGGDADRAQNNPQTGNDDNRQKLEATRSTLQSDGDMVEAMVAKVMAHEISRSVIPPAEDLDRILHYEVVLMKQIDWALRLLTSR